MIYMKSSEKLNNFETIWTLASETNLKNWNWYFTTYVLWLILNEMWDVIRLWYYMKFIDNLFMKWMICECIKILKLTDEMNLKLMFIISMYLEPKICLYLMRQMIESEWNCLFENWLCFKQMF